MNSGQPTEDTGDRPVRVHALTIFPKELMSDFTKDMPKRLEFQTRVRRQQVAIGDCSVHLLPFPGPEPAWFGDQLTHKLVSLVLSYNAPTIADAVKRIATLIDPIIDDMSFQLQEPLKVHELEFLET